jgi:hypothetical protein
MNSETVDESNLVVCYIVLLGERFLTSEGHPLTVCIYTIALFPLLAILRLLDSEDK